MPKELLKDMERKNCHDCNADVGQQHELGCDTERCPKCKQQLISCGCFTIEENGEAYWNEKKLNEFGRLPWTGIMFEEECKFCEEHNLWVKWNNGWVQTTQDDPEATHDINTAVRRMYFDKNGDDLGATGEFPEGQLNQHDEGELKMAIGLQDENVIIDFGKQIQWLGLPKQNAIELANLIMQKANEL